MMRLWRAVFLSGFLSVPANAARNEVEAERERISEEMARLAHRQLWHGVERKFRELERLDTPLTVEDYRWGAYAARENGVVLHTYERLKAAVSIEPKREIVEWLWDLDHNYGHVELIAHRKRTAVLEVDDIPLDPNRRKAIEAAQKSAKSDGIFVGMLPRGNYVFASQAFRVEPGISVRIEVSPRLRRQGLIEPVIIYHKLPSATGDAPSPVKTEK